MKDATLGGPRWSKGSGTSIKSTIDVYLAPRAERPGRRRFRSGRPAGNDVAVWRFSCRMPRTPRWQTASRACGRISRAAAISRRRCVAGRATRLRVLADMARIARVPTVATGDVLYHAPARRILQDVVTCTREGCTIDQAGFRRERTVDRCLKSPDEMARLFARHPEAVARTLEVVERCRGPGTAGGSGRVPASGIGAARCLVGHPRSAR